MSGFSHDGRAEDEEYKRTQEMKNQSGSVRSLDLMTFLPGVDDEFHACRRCGQVDTPGGKWCSKCVRKYS